MQERLMKEYKAGLEKDRAERLGHRPGSSRNRDSHDRKKRRKDRKHREKREIERENKVMFYLSIYVARPYVPGQKDPFFLDRVRC